MAQFLLFDVVDAGKNVMDETLQYAGEYGSIDRDPMLSWFWGTRRRTLANPAWGACERLGAAGSTSSMIYREARTFAVRVEVARRLWERVVVLAETPRRRIISRGNRAGTGPRAVTISVREVIAAVLQGPSAEGDQAVIIWTLRFPRVLLAAIEGASLGVAGAVMQGLFRNPMADPYVLGVSSGASLGAVLGMVTGLSSVLGYWAMPLRMLF